MPIRVPARRAGPASASLYGLGRTMVLSWAQGTVLFRLSSPPLLKQAGLAAAGGGVRCTRQTCSSAVTQAYTGIAGPRRGGWPRKPMQAAARVAGSRNRAVRATLMTAAAVASAAGVLSGCQLRVPCELASEAVRVAQPRLAKGARGNLKAGRMLLRRGNLVQVGAIPPRPGL